MENGKKQKIVAREEWLEARLKLLKEEKELTRRSDEVARHRTEMPWVKVDKAYQFETEKGLSHWQTSLKVVHNSWYIILCSGPITRRVARHAPQSPTVSME
jgi:predicted dithiol-disulfide oxidoreductase (DUF899 family)